MDIQQVIKNAREAFDSGEWPKMSVAERGIYLKRLAALIRKDAKELAEIETKNTGKTIKHTTFIDVPTCADTFEYFGGLDEVTVADQKLAINAPVESTLCREPMGVVGLIIPWNYPLIMAGWKMAPALIAGNAVIFKPSSQASASSVKLAELVKEAGFPDGVVNIVPNADHAAANQIIDSPDVDMVSFTGGTETGQLVMERAAKTTKKLALELGGKSPTIVFADANREAALGGAMSAIFLNQGQMCTAGSRLFIDENIYDEFLEELVKRTKALKIGDPMDYETQFGPLISVEHRDSVLKFIEGAKSEGASVACGGKVPEKFSRGAYIEPTVLTGVRNDMACCQEEAFGPVVCVMRFSSEDEVVKLANDSKYGLAANVWSTDEEKSNRVARKLKCGTVWVNTYGAFYNEAPFGGTKQSGFGRELGADGLLEYTQTKHICQDRTPGGVPLVAGWF